MEWIGVAGIVVGLVFFVIAAMKGWNVLVTSIVTAIIIALTNGMDIAAAMVGGESSYVTGPVSYTHLSLDTALPSSEAAMAMTSTAKGPPAPPAALAAKPTAASENSTSAGARSA